MFWMAAIIFTISLAWVAPSYLSNDMTWEADLLTRYMIASLSATAWLLETKQRPILYRSLIVLLVMYLWLDTVTQIIWMASSHSIDTGLILFVGMCAWAIHLSLRSYDTDGDEVTGDNVFILFLRPRTNLEIVKAFFGVPVASVCIYCDGYVWAYRSRTKLFTKARASKSFLNLHIAFNTCVPASQIILDALDAKVGTKRGCGVRCVYVLKDVLHMLGIAPISPFHYMPGVYANQVLRKA